MCRHAWWPSSSKKPQKLLLALETMKMDRDKKDFLKWNMYKVRNKETLSKERKSTKF